MVYKPLKQDAKDLTQTSKILKGFDEVESSIWFETIGSAPSRQTRQSSYPLNLVRKAYIELISEITFSQAEVLNLGTD